MKKIFTPLFISISLMTMFNVKAQSLVVKYDFSNNLGDSSGSNNHGTNSNVTFANDIAGVPNSAASFNGTSSYVTIPNFVGLGGGAPTHNVGISIWFKTNGNQKPAGIAYAGAQSIGNSPANFTPFMWIDSNGYLACYFYTGQVYPITTVGNDTVNDNKWHHAFFFYHVIPPTSVKQYLWLDGKLQGTWVGSKTGTPSYTNIYLGACNPRNLDGMPDVWSYFNGTIDNFKAYITPNGPLQDSFLHCSDFLITAHPQSQTKSLSSNVTLSVSHTMFANDTVYTYVWKKNGAVVPGATDSVLTIASLSAADTGNYVCEATNNYHLTLTTNAAKIALTPTGINGLQVSDVVDIYPNPANDVLNFSIRGKHISSVEIVAVDGKVVKTIKGEDIRTVDVSSLVHGVYMVKLIADNDTYISRFTKQ